MIGAIAAFLLSALAAVVIVRQLLAVERRCQLAKLGTGWAIFGIEVYERGDGFATISVDLIHTQLGVRRKESGVAPLGLLGRFEAMRESYQLIDLKGRDS